MCELSMEIKAAMASIRFQKAKYAVIDLDSSVISDVCSRADCPNDGARAPKTLCF